MDHLSVAMPTSPAQHPDHASEYGTPTHPRAYAEAKGFGCSRLSKLLCCGGGGGAASGKGDLPSSDDGGKTEFTCADYKPSTLVLKRAGAEFIGTFLLIFACAGTSIMNDKTDGGLKVLGLSIAAGLAVMIIIFSTGHISGAHLNPAVTLAFATIKEFPWSQVPIYFVSQITASVFASFTLKMVLQPIHDSAVGVTVPTGTHSQAFVVEFIITFTMMFVVTAVATDNRAVGELAGIAVGATVILNNLIASPLTGASMNPVRTLGPALIANNFKGIWVYIFGPSLGALAGTAAYSLIKIKNVDGTVGRSIRR